MFTVCFSFYITAANLSGHMRVTVRRALPRPPNKHFLQVSQSRYANLIDRHASIKSFNTQLPNENLSILTDEVEAVMT